MAVGNFWDKVKKVAFLDPTIYKYVSDDEDSYKDAMLIVALSSFSVAIQKVGVDETMSFQANFIFTFLSWFFVSAIIFYFGSLWFAEPPPEIEEEEEEDEEDLLTSQEVKRAEAKVGYLQVLRVIGFAYAPGILRLFGIFRGLVGLSSMIAAIWILITAVIAIRTVFSYKSSIRALLVLLVSVIIYGSLCNMVFPSVIFY